MKYTLQEGSFSLFPAAWQDNTINILRDDNSGLSLVVTRGAIPDGSDVEQELQRQWEMLRAQAGEITRSGFVRVTAGADNSLRAVAVESAFVRNHLPLWQKQLALQLPAKPVMLLFTLSALRPFSEEDGQRWSALQQSLTLNDNRG
ncbi:DcrB-related protein [Pantoea sp. B65]|uniref:DcrB-related protein n=1 Tax=Pantoea sp. B65 TaxID=2813359 RepID=UPI0039B6C33E